MRALLIFFLPFAIFFAPPAAAGGLSGNTARRAMCGDVLAQCMDRVKADIPCTEENTQACDEARRVRARTCAMIFSHCMASEPAVKRAKPVFPGKEKKAN